ncbi:MAG: hypothetical protein AAF996_18720 [Pseudomonadota bacterium]
MIHVMNSDSQPHRGDVWLFGIPATIVKGLCGVIAVLVALKAAAFVPSEPPAFDHQEHFVRILAFAALTVWTAFAIGPQRRGMAAMMTLVFAVFVEMFLIPARDAGVPSIIAANLGIVLAWSSLELYCLSKARVSQD